jgi:hypothetical protein
VAHPTWAPADVDTTTPSIARVYDYWIGGEHNFPADRELARTVAAANPALPRTVRANRGFLQRAVRAVAGLGVRQFLDIGAGIPATASVHETVFAVDGDCRVVYADTDPVAVAHGGEILDGEPRAAFIQGDLHTPSSILDAPQTRELIDFDQPVALVMAALLHFVDDDHDPAGLVAGYMGRLAPGSFLVLSHAGVEQVPEVAPAIARSYQKAVSEVIWRGPAAVRALFGGLDLIEPGIVQVTRWRPDGPVDAEGLGEATQMLAGVARKNG